ncbi:MAG TPA: Tad domain-containing protein [Dehalococcoidia bacterium]|nr:Tad domain-containing protein [Dehalococcoidia bacterium]
MHALRWLRGKEPCNRGGRDGERGQSLVLWALALVAIVGMAGLTLDGSNTVENRRKLQNAADAAAFAGAYDLPVSNTQATTDSVQWLTKNNFGSASDSVVTNAVSSTNFTNDTITVSLKRNVPFSLARVLGITSANVTATAKVVIGGASEFTYCPGSGNSCSGSFFPYTVWNNRVDTNLPHQVNDIVTYRSTSWIAENVYQYRTNPAWNTNANDFKGFLCFIPPGCDYTVVLGENRTKGGNRCGQEPVSQLQAIQKSGSPYIVLPITDASSGSGDNQVLHVIGFVTLDISVDTTGLPNGCPNDFTGKIIKFTSTEGTFQSGDPQPPTYAQCGTGIGTCTPHLVQ